jgi:hypothetical protein
MGRFYVYADEMNRGASWDSIDSYGESDPQRFFERLKSGDLPTDLYKALGVKRPFDPKTAVYKGPSARGAFEGNLSAEFIDAGGCRLSIIGEKDLGKVETVEG